MGSENILFRAEHIYKAFGSVQALDDFSIEIGAGEIRGLIGENGSGKSTFSSIAAGIQRCDQGEMFIEGRSYRPSGITEAVRNGISMVVQEQGTIAKISVAANIFFGNEKQFAKGGVLNVGRMNQEAAGILEKIGADDIAPDAMIDSLTFEDRKLVELARALYTQPKLWIIDETTTALSVSGRQILYTLMQQHKERGGSILFISHDLDEITDKCDSLTVLRDGVLTANLKKEEFDQDRIRQLMIGRELSGHYYREDMGGDQSGEVVLEAHGVTTDVLRDVTIRLHRGEILGIGGLSDCGIHDLGRVLCGLIPPYTGNVLKNEKENVKDAAWAVRNGIGYISKNRDRESLMTVCSIRDNICLPSLKEISRHGFISTGKQKALAEKWTTRMEVKAQSIATFVNTLSGGNKQKVVLAKWLAKDSQILILDCPTRGIDVGTKAAIYKLIMQLKDQGKSILLISEELQELIGMSDRIILLKDGRVSGEFFRKDGLTEAKLIQKMV